MRPPRLMRLMFDFIMGVMIGRNKNRERTVNTVFCTYELFELSCTQLSLAKNKIGKGRLLLGWLVFC
jgi:hypothetical protein